MFSLLLPDNYGFKGKASIDISIIYPKIIKNKGEHANEYSDTICIQDISEIVTVSQQNNSLNVGEKPLETKN